MAVFENTIVGILIAGTILALGISAKERNNRDSESPAYNAPNVAYRTNAPEAVRMSGDYNDLPNATQIPNAYAYRGGKTKRKSKKLSRRNK